VKKLLPTVVVLLAAQALLPAPGGAQPSFTVLLAGGDEANMIHIWVAADGRDYVIDSAVPLEVGGDICANPVGNPNELVCDAPAIAGFEVNAGGGDDNVTVAQAIAIPVTMRGGAGDDRLVGGRGDDKLLGGTGDDRLVGGAGDDALYGGPGRDVLRGGPGNDVLHGGPGQDVLRGGRGENNVRQYRRYRH
jgi:Ca2+-binding RTX toxin-like protein